MLICGHAELDLSKYVMDFYAPMFCVRTRSTYINFPFLIIVDLVILLPATKF